MIKELNGSELAGFIKERQLRQVRNLKQEHNIELRLAVLMGTESAEVSDVYVRMKQRYAQDIGIICEVIRVAEDELSQYIDKINVDSNIYGIIIQLPLKNTTQTQELCNRIDPDKDVDGLGEHAKFVGATAEAIDWLLSGYNIELDGKKLAIVGYGKLVGQPLEFLWRSKGLDVSVVDVDTADARKILTSSDVIVSATGVPRRLVSDDVALGAVVVDAGTATEDGMLVGDADDTLRSRNDITITPLRGGVGPMTVAVLFDHVIQAGLKRAGLLH